MFIPIPLSFKNPKSAQTFNIVAIIAGIAVIALFNMWLLGACLIGFSVFNLIRSGAFNNVGGGNSSMNTRGRNPDGRDQF